MTVIALLYGRARAESKLNLDVFRIPRPKQLGLFYAELHSGYLGFGFLCL